MKKIKKLNRSMYGLALFLLLLTVGAGALSFSGWRVFLPGMDISKITKDSVIKEKTVASGKIALVPDYVAEDTKEGAKFYLVPNGTGDYLLVDVYDEVGKKFAALQEQTYEVMTGERDDITEKPIKLHGLIWPMNSTLKEYALDWMEESGYAEVYVDGSAEDHLLPYVVVYAPVSKWFSSRDVIAIILGVIFACVAVYICIYVATGKNLKQPKELFLADGISDTVLDEEMERAATVKGVRFYATPRYLIYPSGATVYAVRGGEMVWAYVFHQITQHKLYGIVPMGKTHAYSIKFILRNGGQGALSVGGSEEKAKEVLKTLGETYPQLITEQGEAMFKLANTDFGALLRKSELQRQQYEMNHGGQAENKTIQPESDRFEQVQPEEIPMDTVRE